MFTTGNTTFRTIFGTVGTVICAGVCLVAATAPAQAADALFNLRHIRCRKTEPEGG